MRARKSLLFLLATMLIALVIGMVGADDGQMFRRNVSRTPDAETEDAQLGMMYLYVPAQHADGTIEPIEYYDAEGALVFTRDYAKPLVVSYIDNVGHHDDEIDSSGPTPLSGVTFGEFDTFGAVSLDDGATWKEFNLSRAADLSSFTLANGQPYPGSTAMAVHAVAGDRVMVAWTSKYCDSGQPNYTLTADEIDILRGMYPDLHPLYFDLVEDGVAVDLFGVSGTQQSVDYTLQGFPEVGEIPYSCVWTARGSLELLDDGAGGEKYDIVWFKPERLTSGRRDANKIEIDAVAGAGFAIMWQEDPEGLRPGQGLGPGEGWSGAIVNSKTDIWYSFLPWDLFELVDNDGDISTEPVPIELYALTGDEEMPKAAVQMAMPIRLTDNDMCKDASLGMPEDPYCYFDFDTGTIYDDPHADSDLCATVLSWTNPGGTTLNVCQTEDGRVLTGRIGASRPRFNMWPRDIDGDGITDTAWVMMAYEETKALGTGVDDDDVDPVDIGKNVWYHSFDMFEPDIAWQGGILNQPAIDRETGAFFEMQVDEWGNPFYETEIARRFSIISQPLENVGDSGTVSFMLFKQGIINQGGPADIFARRFVLPDGFDPLTENPYAYENMVCDAWDFADGSNPYYLQGICLNPPINVSGTTIISCDNGTGGEACADSFPWDGGESYPKVTEWRQCDGTGAIAGCVENDLDDQSWENPFDVAKGHRGFIDGDFLMVIYAWSPNWKANSVGNDHYNLYARRSFDGGLTFTTTPGDLGGTGTEYYEYYYGATVGEVNEYLWTYSAGAFEQARNVSKLTGNRETVLDPRYTPTGGGNLVGEVKCYAGTTDADAWDTCSIDGLPYVSDEARDPSKYFLVFETGDNTTVAEGEAVPLDLFYSRGTVYGDIYDEVEYENAAEPYWYWDWLEKKQDDLSGEAALTTNLAGDFLYAVWNQWNEFEEEVVTNSDAWFRRVLYLDDEDGLPTATIIYVTQYGADPADGDIVLIGSAWDNDHMGDGIVAYRWRSSIDGDLGSDKTLIISANTLSPGMHILYFTAQDGEGNWATEASVPMLIADDVHEVRLPIIFR